MKIVWTGEPSTSSNNVDTMSRGFSYGTFKDSELLFPGEDVTLNEDDTCQGL